MNKSGFTLEGLGGGGRKHHPQPQHSEEVEGEGRRGRTQMAPGPFAAEKLTLKGSPVYLLPFLLDV